MAEQAQVTVFWRPGCGFCAGLFRGLEKAGFDDFQRVNIWDEPDGASYVRSVADGNEVVPTVRIGDVGLVNPSVDQLLRALHAQAPAKVPAGWEPRKPGRAASFVNRMLGGEA